MGASCAAAVGGNGVAGGRGAGPKTSSGSALGRESGEGEGVRAIWLTRESLGGSGRGRRDEHGRAISSMAMLRGRGRAGQVREGFWRGIVRRMTGGVDEQ